MSSLWTPSGEHQVNEPTARGTAGGATPSSAPPTAPPGAPPGEDVERQAALDELRQQLAEAPPEVVVANHCYGLFELGAIYLSQDPPLLGEASLAIDAMGAVVETRGPRLGEVEPSLREALAQLRLAFVQVQAAERARQDVANGADQA
jgi:hypothetical protein